MSSQSEIPPCHDNSAEGRSAEQMAVAQKKPERPAMADPEDEALAALSKELGRAYVRRYRQKHGVTGIEKYSPGGGKSKPHVSPEQAALMRSAQAPLAEATDVPFHEIARRAQIGDAALAAGIHQVEASYMQLKRPAPGLKPGPHLPELVAQATVYRLQAQPLPACLLPTAAIALRFETTLGAVYHQLHRKIGAVAIKLRLVGSRGRHGCYSWQDIIRLEQRLPLPEGQPIIELDKLPTGPEDTRPDRIAYARELQARYVPASQLIQFPRAPRAFINLNQAAPVPDARPYGNRMRYAGPKIELPLWCTMKQIAYIMRTSKRDIVAQLRQSPPIPGQAKKLRGETIYLRPDMVAQIARQVVRERLRLHPGHMRLDIMQLSLLAAQHPDRVLQQIKESTIPSALTRNDKPIFKQTKYLRQIFDLLHIKLDI